MSKKVDFEMELTGNAEVDAGIRERFNLENMRTVVEMTGLLDDLLSKRASMTMPGNLDGPHKVLHYLQTIRGCLNVDGPHCDVPVTLLRCGFIESFMRNAPTALRFDTVVDEALRLLIGLTRIKIEDIATSIVSKLFANGGLVFCILALKSYMRQSSNIRIQALELMTILLSFVSTSSTSKTDSMPSGVEIEDKEDKGEKEGQEDDKNHVNKTNNGVTFTALRHTPTENKTDSSNKMVQDCIHQILLHGAAALFIRLLAINANNKNDIGIKRAIFCLQFLLYETPKQMTLKVASYDNYSCVRTLCALLESSSRNTKGDVSILLTAFLSTSKEVAKLITSLGAWNHLSTVLVQHSESIKVPPSWLEGALESIRNVDDVAQGPASAITNKNNDNNKNKGLNKSKSSDLLVSTYGGGNHPHNTIANLHLESENDELTYQGSLEEALRALMVDNLNIPDRNRVKPPSRHSNSRRGMSPNTENNLRHSTSSLPLNEQGDYIDALQMQTMNSLPSFHKPDLNDLQRRNSNGEADDNNGYGPNSPQMRPKSSCSRLPGGYKQPVEPIVNSWDVSNKRPKSSGGRNSPVKDSKFVQRLKQSPLGVPVNPDTIRDLRKQNKGKLPQHIPHVLGGPKLGSRPGPDYGSKMKRPASSSGGRTGGGRDELYPSNAPPIIIPAIITPLATDGDIRPFVPGNHTYIGGDDNNKSNNSDEENNKNEDNNNSTSEEEEDNPPDDTQLGELFDPTSEVYKKKLKQAKKNAHRSGRHAKFVAEKLFNQQDHITGGSLEMKKNKKKKKQKVVRLEAERLVESFGVPLDNHISRKQSKEDNGKNVIDKLSFRERLQTMILQVQELKGNE